jgi:hypothetical protein
MAPNLPSSELLFLAYFVKCNWRVEEICLVKRKPMSSGDLLNRLTGKRRRFGSFFVEMVVKDSFFWFYGVFGIFFGVIS